MLKIAFAGNPNVGKSALINALAGSKLKVGNWPGVTVEKKEANFIFNGEKINLIDLPGVYSLSPYSLEEKVTRDFILDENPDVVINVLDSTNLERNLYLTLLLKELGKPMIIALNFFDEFENLDYTLDTKKLSAFLEMDIVKTSATKETGLKELLEKAIILAKNSPKNIDYKLEFEDFLINKINTLKLILKENASYAKIIEKYNINFVAVKILERDKYFAERILAEYKIDVTKEFENIIKNIESRFDNDIETIFAEKRYGVIKGITRQTFKTSLKARLDFTDKIDRLFLNRILGLPLFFGIMTLMMNFVFKGSQPFIDWLDTFINSFLAGHVKTLLEGVPNWMNSLIVDGIIGGVGGIIVFVPLMLFLYFFLAILEESGYMTRVAFLMDKVMRGLGLNGKAFVPMIIGFGCSVPAIYATRTLEDKNSRRLTALMTPFMSCGARLPVYGLFTAAFFGAQAGLVIMSLYALGILIAILVGVAFKKFPIFRSDNKPLILELPPYRIPSMKMVFNSTINRTAEYLKKASTTIMTVLMLLWVLTYFPNNGDTSKSYMASFGKVLTPIMKPTGFATRWEVVAAIPPSIAAKELVVGFLGQVLVQDDSQNNVANNSETEKERGIVTATSKLWSEESFPKLRAYSFMVFILLVVPCIVALTALKNEFGFKFMGFVVLVMTVVPYIISTLIFQIGRLIL
ncbi:MAG: ferrous iron transport protein B [Fusobacteriaceae bacterium]